MLLQQTKVVDVYYRCDTKVVTVGKLALKERKIFFEYDRNFLEQGLELSPFKLPLKQGLIICQDHLFNGLFGLFNDSLPDGWGRLLLDRKLRGLEIQPEHLTPLDRLAYVGTRGMGALFYKPEIDNRTSSTPDDLDLIAYECLQLQEHDDDHFVDTLLVMAGSSGGARPKILVSFTDESLHAMRAHSITDQSDWIIKFNSSLDPQDSGSIEFAYHLMARAAGLDVPEAILFKSKKCPGYFGVKRFDRLGSRFLHMHTASGLLHADHRVPSLDYETLMKATMWLTKDIHMCEKQFRNAVFNVLAHNRDDHSKNFSFLMNEKGTWYVAPAYDLTFSSGPGGEHCTAIMGEGKHPTIQHLLNLADVGSITNRRALEIVDEVQHAILRWDNYAQQAKVTEKSFRTIKKVLDQVMERF